MISFGSVKIKFIWKGKCMYCSTAAFKSSYQLFTQRFNKSNNIKSLGFLCSLQKWNVLLFHMWMWICHLLTLFLLRHVGTLRSYLAPVNRGQVLATDQHNRIYIFSPISLRNAIKVIIHEVSSHISFTRGKSSSDLKWENWHWKLYPFPNIQIDLI